MRHLTRSKTGTAMVLKRSFRWLHIWFLLQIAQRTISFIHNCLNEIRILEIHYPAGAIACWIFLCCLEVVFTCKSYNDPAHVDACSLYTAPLMELAMIKVGQFCFVGNKLGATGHQNLNKPAKFHLSRMLSLWNRARVSYHGNSTLPLRLIFSL